MKKLITMSMIIAVAFAACNDNKAADPEEVAEDKNEMQFDNSLREDDARFAVEAASGALM